MYIENNVEMTFYSRRKQDSYRKFATSPGKSLSMLQHPYQLPCTATASANKIIIVTLMLVRRDVCRWTRPFIRRIIQDLYFFV